MWRGRSGNEQGKAHCLVPRIEERQLHALYYEVELPLCRVLAEMELAGVRVDAKALADFGAAMDAELKTLEERIYEEADGSFNINSPKQLGEVLFDRLGLPHGKKTKTGWSTNVLSTATLCAVPNVKLA